MATAKTSLALDGALIAEARQRAGRRSLSRYVNRALRNQLKRDRLAELLDELEREAGAIEPRIMEEVRRAWPSPVQAESRGA